MRLRRCDRDEISVRAGSSLAASPYYRLGGSTGEGEASGSKVVEPKLPSPPDRFVTTSSVEKDYTSVFLNSLFRFGDDESLGIPVRSSG